MEGARKALLLGLSESASLAFWGADSSGLLFLHVGCPALSASLSEDKPSLPLLTPFSIPLAVRVGSFFLRTTLGEVRCPPVIVCRCLWQ